MITLLKTVGQQQPELNSYTDSLKLQLKLVIMDAEENIANQADLERLKSYAESVQEGLS